MPWQLTRESLMYLHRFLITGNECFCDLRLSQHWLCKIFNQRLKPSNKDTLAIRWGISVLYGSYNELLSSELGLRVFLSCFTYKVIASFYRIIFSILKERIQLETSRLYRQAGVNPLAGTKYSWVCFFLFLCFFFHCCDLSWYLCILWPH